MGRILEIVLEGLFIYFLYRFIVGFVIPVYRSTKQVRNRMHEMQDRMNDHIRQQQQRYSTNKAEQPSKETSKNQTKGKEGEYIDYEEVK
jgi:hypothetical protein